MKKLFFVCLGIVNFLVGAPLLHAQPSQQFPFIGTVIYPNSVKHPERLGVLYKGMVYKFDMYPLEANQHRAGIEILESRDCTELFLLITEELDLPKSPAVTHLFTAAGNPYALYRLQRVTHFEQPTNEQTTPASYYEWQITRIEQKQDSLRLPENTIVLLMNPELIELETVSWKPDDVAIKLPTIIFKNIDNEPEFNALCRKMLFSMMDIKFLHTDATKLSKQVAANCVISVPSTFLKS